METIVKLDESAEEVVREVVGGGTKYRHIVTCNVGNLCETTNFRLEIINEDATKFTTQTLWDYLESRIDEDDYPCIVTYSTSAYLDSVCATSSGDIKFFDFEDFGEQAEVSETDAYDVVLPF